MPDIELKKILNEKYRERSIWRGITNRGKMVEVFISEKPNRTWTIVYWVTPNYGCMVDAGSNWHSKVIHYLGDEL